ncbi:MAG: hypothetical protein MHMPM18_002364 [Marteilia pararefringens]
MSRQLETIDFSDTLVGSNRERELVFGLDETPQLVFEKNSNDLLSTLTLRESDENFVANDEDKHNKNKIWYLTFSPQFLSKIENAALKIHKIDDANSPREITIVGSAILPAICFRDISNSKLLPNELIVQNIQIGKARKISFYIENLTDAKTYIEIYIKDAYDMSGPQIDIKGDSKFPMTGKERRKIDATIRLSFKSNTSLNEFISFKFGHDNFQLERNLVLRLETNDNIESRHETLEVKGSKLIFNKNKLFSKFRIQYLENGGGKTNNKAEIFIDDSVTNGIFTFESNKFLLEAGESRDIEVECNSRRIIEIFSRISSKQELTKKFHFRLKIHSLSMNFCRHIDLIYISSNSKRFLNSSKSRNLSALSSISRNRDQISASAADSTPDKTSSNSAICFFDDIRIGGENGKNGHLQFQFNRRDEIKIDNFTIENHNPSVRFKVNFVTDSKDEDAVTFLSADYNQNIQRKIIEPSSKINISVSVRNKFEEAFGCLRIFIVISKFLATKIEGSSSESRGQEQLNNLVIPMLISYKNFNVVWKIGTIDPLDSLRIYPDSRQIQFDPIFAPTAYQTSKNLLIENNGKNRCLIEFESNSVDNKKIELSVKPPKFVIESHRFNIVEITVKFLEPSIFNNLTLAANVDNCFAKLPLLLSGKCLWRENEPIVSISKDRLQFPRVAAGSSMKLFVTIRNLLQNSVSLSMNFIDQDDYPGSQKQFSIEQSEVENLNPRSEYKLFINFAPQNFDEEIEKELKIAATTIEDGTMESRSEIHTLHIIGKSGIAEIEIDSNSNLQCCVGEKVLVPMEIRNHSKKTIASTDSLEFLVTKKNMNNLKFEDHNSNFMCCLKNMQNINMYEAGNDIGTLILPGTNKLKNLELSFLDPGEFQIETKLSNHLNEGNKEEILNKISVVVHKKPFIEILDIKIERMNNEESKFRHNFPKFTNFGKL